MRDALAAQRIRLPLALSEGSNELGVVRDADGMAVFTVDTESTWPDQRVLGVAAMLIAALNATTPRPPAAATEVARSALEAIAAILAPIAETSDAAMAAFQVAEDACTELAHAEPSADA